MALIPPFFMDCVVAIGTLNDKSETAWIGTGFLYGKLIAGSNPKRYMVYLVTNRHVLENLKIGILRFNPHTAHSAKDFPIDLVDAAGKLTWSGHPNSKVDVAVMDINVEVLQQEGLKYGFFSSDDHSLCKSEMQKMEITEGDFIYVLGFPMGLVAKDRQHVILRQGVIARIRDFFENWSMDYIVDAIVFPGNSGGPVILKPEVISIEGTKTYGKAALIGLIKSYIPYQDIAISQQTKRPRIIFEENSGLSLVEPVDHILETITENEKRVKNV